MGAVYFTVARGVTVGAIEVVNSTISFNTTAVGQGKEERGKGKGGRRGKGLGLFT